MFYDISAESVEIYRRNHVNCNLLPYRIDADVLLKMQKEQPPTRG